MQKLIFEPHNLHGQTIDGEDMPFGYISAIQESGYRLPVFELNTVFGPMPGFDRPALARSMAESPAMVAALRGNLQSLIILRGAAPVYTPKAGLSKADIQASIDATRAILSRIDGAGEALPDAPAPAPTDVKPVHMMTCPAIDEGDCNCDAPAPAPARKECASKHFDRGDDICADCGADLS